MSVLPIMFGVSGGTAPAAPTAIQVVIGLFGLAALAFMFVCLWKIFVKAGRPGWQAVIPVYSSWVLAEIGGKPGWWGLLTPLVVIPGVGTIVALAAWVVIMLGVARNFGKDVQFAILGLVVFPVAGYFMLAFGGAKYKPKHHVDD